MTSISANLALENPVPLWRRLLFSEYLVLYLSLAYFLAVAPFVPGFASGENAGNILSKMLPLLLVAMGQTFVLITGGIDLSVTATISLASVLGAQVMTGDGGLLMGHPAAAATGMGAMLLTGAVIGMVNGTAVAWLRMPPFIVTLTLQMFVAGLAIWLTQSRSIYSLPGGFTALGKETWMAFFAVGALALVAHAVLSRSILGKWVYAVGHNSKAARVSGVPVGQVIFWVYVISGLFAAAASILYTGRLETGSPTMGRPILLDVIGATVIGGTSLFGGKGKIIWTVFGVLFLTLLDNSLNLMGLSHFSIMMVKGSFILLAALLDAIRNKLAGGA